MALSVGIAGVAVSAAGVASSAIKGSQSGKTQDQANAAGDDATAIRQQITDLYNTLELPAQNTTPLQSNTWLQDYNPTSYTPTLPTQSFMSDDPAALAAQNQALQQMQQLAKGGLQPADLMALQQIQQQQAGAASSQNAATMANMQARGLGGAGATLAASLAGNQGAANTTNSLYSQAMQAAMARQVNAINSSATTAGGIRAQSDTVSQQMANMNNAFNEQIASIRNAAALNAQTQSNQAQASNLQGRQNVANQNVTTANQNVALENQLAQQQFLNQNTKIGGQVNGLVGQATNASAQQAALNNQALGQQNALNSSLSDLGKLAGTATDPKSTLGQLFDKVGGTSTTTPGFTDNGMLFDGVNSDGTFNI